MLDETKLQELRTKARDGRIEHVVGKGDAWEIVLGAPSRPIYKKFRAMSHNASLVADAQEDFCRATVMYPDRIAFDALLDRFPGIPEACGNAIQSLCGMATESDLKTSGLPSNPSNVAPTTSARD